MSRTKAFGAASRGQTFTYVPETLVLVTDRSHPLYDERVALPVRESLVLSIMTYGVLEPILCRKNGKRADGTAIVEVVNGRQRVRAACEVNRRLVAAGKEPLTVEAKLRGAGADDAIGCMITTNEIVVVDDIVTRAMKLARLLARGCSREDAQIAFGVDARGLAALEAVANLSKEAQVKLREGAVSRAGALELAKLPEVEQRAVVADLPKSARLTAAAVRKASGRALSKQPRARSAKQLRTMTANVEAGDVRGSPAFLRGLLAGLVYALGNDSTIKVK